MSTSPNTTQPSTQVPGELVSALVDGQLRGPLLAQTVREVTQDPAALMRWHNYHLIGEALRAPRSASLASASPDFLVRLRHRLAAEAPVLKPGIAHALSVGSGAAGRAPKWAFALRAAANEPAFFWKAMSACASAAAVTVLAWHLLLSSPDTPQWAQSAPQQLPANALTAVVSGSVTAPDLQLVASPKGPVLRDRRLQELLAAHKQVASHSALPMPASFLRQATFEATADATR